MADFLFAYGTMIHKPLEEQVQIAMDRYTEHVDHAWVHGELYDLGDFPGAIPQEPGPAAGRVMGRILRLHDARRFFRVLDEYEEVDFQLSHSGTFRRDRADAHPFSRPNRPIECWIYWINRVGSSAPRIESGDWIHYVESRRKRRR